MESDSFFKMAKKSFGFLIEEYGYKVSDKRYVKDKPFSDGAIEFNSSKTTIRVEKDGGAFTVIIKPTNEPEITSMSLPWILLEARRIVSFEELPGEVPPSHFNHVLDHYAKLLKMYCSDYILGNFSHWLEILQYYVEKSKRDYFSRTGKELPERIHKELEDYIKSKEGENR